MRAERVPDAATRDAQHRAADPAHSAWVSANAGSGKTHVLAARVARLLLDGVPPARILCLTFTKAAAANMSARVFKWLGEWAVADEATLRTKLAGIGVATPVSFDIARKLFARAVETPGGLKIQTIHAFCERVLHLFPFEANVPAGFRVVDEVEQSELLADARQGALAGLRKGNDADRAALALVADNTWDDGFIGLLGEMLRHRGILASMPRHDRAPRRREALGLAPDETESALREIILYHGIARDTWLATAGRLAIGSGADSERADDLRDAAALPDEAAVIAYLDLFRTKDGKDWRKRMVSAGLSKNDPALGEMFDREMARLQLLREKWLATRIAARTEALERLCEAVIAHYETAKQSRALLDFDDLIAKIEELLTHAHVSNWVLYKLDGGIDHILVDEAQDTSAPQWSILDALSREFAAGAGRSRARRTFFAVGDEKQSIFSFQGAAPQKFDAMRRDYDTRWQAAELAFPHVRLQLSFHSAPPILDAVDALFSDADRRRGLSSDPAAPSHSALKIDLPGLVEMWPPLKAEEPAPPDSWVLPPDGAGAHEPPALLAHKIATKIAALVATDSLDAIEGATPGSRRAIQPGDIMILVRRRDAFFEAVIRALKDKGVRVAGADRLDVVGHIAVMDCVAAARVALLPEDDLSLASVLKSPLIGLNDDDLIALAPMRKGSLFEALVHSVEPHHRKAATKIARWRERAPHVDPFEFFATILGAEGGRRAMLSRLGAEANDALDEFLNLALVHERHAAPSLTTFLAMLDTLTLDVKRDLETGDDAVRVMTVHAAKGLEAKIVFLPDTCAVPPPQLDPKLYVMDTPGGGVIAWTAGAKNDPPALTAARETFRRAQEDEYRRLLYVAMTRAEERLYISGYFNLKKPPGNCWHTMVWDALEPISRTVPDAREEFETILQFGEGLMLDAPEMLAPVAADEPLPSWLTAPARTDIAPLSPLRPSGVLESADSLGSASAGSLARARGIAIHALLHRLPTVVPAERTERGRELLSTLAPDLDADALLSEALRVIEHPSLAPLFGPDSLAEVPIAAMLPRPNGGLITVSGQIDRLAEHEGAMIVADFKTGASGPLPDAAHVAQVALYVAALRQIDPSRPVRALLVYTRDLRVLELEKSTIDTALAQDFAET